jgi:hypothetical protein
MFIKFSLIWKSVDYAGTSDIDDTEQWFSVTGISWATPEASIFLYHTSGNLATKVGLDNLL